MTTNLDRRIAALRDLPVATLAEAMSSPCDLPPEIRQMTPGVRVVGPAFTVRCPLGDNTAVTHAVDQAAAGDVLVIDSGGPARTAVWGETATYACRLKGIAGCVTNGAIRDIEEIIATSFPVFAVGLSLRHSRKGQPGQLGVPIAIGDIIVRPGDLVCGGAEGVVVIPSEQADVVILAAAGQRDEELSRNERLRAGTPLAEILSGRST